MKNRPATGGTDRESPEKTSHEQQGTGKSPEPPLTPSDWKDAAYHLLKIGGTPAFWGGAYVALTGALLVAGVLGTGYVATVAPPDLAHFVVIILAIGSAAASPTVARLILIRINRRFVGSSATRADAAAMTGPPAITQRSEEGLR